MKASQAMTQQALADEPPVSSFEGGELSSLVVKKAAMVAKASILCRCGCGVVRTGS